ncbi:MAG: response regulator [Candidatus Sumerlaeota bacterium]|nr:response regulator [Candidatus Sumerlaeota bacterium]
MAESKTNAPLAAEELIHSIPIAVATLDAAGMLTAANPAAARLLSLEQGRGYSLSELFKGSYFDPAREILGTLDRAGAWQGVLPLIASDGCKRRLRGQFVRLAQNGGMAVGFLEEESDLCKLRDRLDEAERMLSVGRMAGGIAHNVNNAMVAILGYSSMMQDLVREDERLSRFVGRIVSAAHRAADLIRQFLSFSQKGGVRPVLLNAGDVAEIAAKLFMKSHPAQVRIACDVAPELPLFYAIPSQMEQAFNSLFTLIFEQAGQGALELEIAARLALPAECAAAENQGRVREAVAVEVGGRGAFDQGRALQSWNALMAPETKADGVEERQMKGSLALSAAFVREVLREHHGWMTAAADAEGVARLRVFFPTRAALEAGAPAENLPPSDTRVPGATMDGKTARRPATVLIIDDEILVLELVMDLLTESGFKVLLANGGRKGLEIASAGAAIDVVLLDRAMPDLDGLDVYLKLREMCPDLPVIVSSGHSPEDSRAGLPEDPRLGFIQKPYHFTELVSSINRML